MISIVEITFKGVSSVSHLKSENKTYTRDKSLQTAKKAQRGVRGRELALIITWQTRKVFNLLYFTHTIKPEKAIDEDETHRKLTMNV